MDDSSNKAQSPLRILLVDDHEVVRSGLRALIEGGNSDLVVVGEAENAAEGIRRAELDRPDLVVMDLRLPDASGITACREITSRHPEIRVLILTSYADDAAVRAAAHAGASGYLLKRVSAFDLVSVIRRVAAGEELFGPELKPIEAVEAAEESEDSLSVLTPQERAIARHIANGLTNREIADEMSLAEKTVKNYVSHLLTKMGWSRRSEAAAQVARMQAERERWEEPVMKSRDGARVGAR